VTATSNAKTDADAAVGRLIVVGGGARSGKSRFALARAESLGRRRAFVATAEALDGEMADRIRRHRQDRGPGFETIEEPLELAAALERAYQTADVVVVDCLTFWVSNLLMGGASPPDLAAAFDRLVAVLQRRPIAVILVSNEVGMGLVPETPLGRGFRDAVGVLHQRLAAEADELYVGVMGQLLRLRPAPLALEPEPAPPTSAPVPARERDGG
jgi:adenosylcobinamide kinase/adenosylcobinamide-phosphate guanylyltransferase